MPPVPNPCCGLYKTIESVDYAIYNGARVSNNSYGGPGFTQAAYDGILAGQAFGHIFVAAAGNGGADGIGDNNDVTPFYPASYDLTNIISVAAHDDDGDLASFSNYGVVNVDLGAPGVDVYSTLSGSTYGEDSGTSMAAPHVTGAVALIAGNYPSATWQEVRTRILNAVTFNPEMNGKVATSGQLNAFRGLGLWLDPSDPPETEAGSYWKPFHRHNTQYAHNILPLHGVYNFKPGVIPAANAAFVWNRPMILRARSGDIILGD
jgi:subtilisin family serine protease